MAVSWGEGCDRDRRGGTARPSPPWPPPRAGRRGGSQITAAAPTGGRSTSGGTRGWRRAPSPACSPSWTTPGGGESGCPRSALVIDEAGLVDSATLARLIDHAEAAEAKLVLVGDPAQLGEIEAGRALRGARGAIGADRAR